MTFFDKPGAAEVTYSHKFTMLKLVAQIPQACEKHLSEEKNWTAETRKSSINHEDHSVTIAWARMTQMCRPFLMTHLLKFPVPRPFSPVAQWQLRRFARRFFRSMGPRLSTWSDVNSRTHSRRKAIHPTTKFIGILSRLVTPSKELTQTSSTPIPTCRNCERT